MTSASHRQPATSPAPAGFSSTAEAFDADVSIQEQGNSLFFVVARAGAPDVAVRSVGGAVVTRMQDDRRVLALAPLAAHSALRDHPDLELSGPVAIDPQRFERFARLIGLGEPRSPTS